MVILWKEIACFGFRQGVKVSPSVVADEGQIFIGQLRGFIQVAERSLLI